MLRAAQYEYPIGVQFTINCYRHWDNLVVRDADRSVHLFHRKYGLTQEDPYAISNRG